jgi:NifU-like protein involved in Fe-S cluster formation
MKNPVIKDHFLNPRRMGDIANPTHTAVIHSEICKDILRMTLIIDGEGIVSDIGTSVYGCGYAIAGASIFNEIALGKKAGEIISTAEIFINGIITDVTEHNINCLKLALRAFLEIHDEFRLKD